MRACVLGCTFLLACSEVTIVPNDGGSGADDGGGPGTGAGTPGVGGTGTGGGGGGPVPEPRMIEIALVGASDGDIEGVGVLVNRADGSLRASYSGGELPAMAEVVDGDMVSFSVPDNEPGKRLSSYRVRPGVWRIAEYGPPGGVDCAELEPMSVTLDVPFVEGADNYRIHTRFDAVQVEPGTQTIELSACTTDEAEPLLLLARAGVPYEPLAFQYFELTYVPGGAVTLTTDLVSDHQEIALVTGDAAAEVNGWWIPDDRPFPWGSQSNDWQPMTGGFAGTIIAPGGGYTWMNVFGVPGVTSDGSCTRAHQQLQIASSSGPVTVEASTFDLAQPVVLADGSVALADGLRGDYIYRAYSNDVDVYYWDIYDDPAAEWLPVVFPELPAGDPWNLDPGGPLAPLGDVIHEDDDAVAGYASFAAEKAPAFSPGRTRSVGPCD